MFPKPIDYNDSEEGKKKRASPSMCTPVRICTMSLDVSDEGGWWSTCDEEM